MKSILSVLAAVILFGLTFSSCKACDKDENKGKGNLVTGKTTNEPDGKAVQDNSEKTRLCQIAVKEAQDAESKAKSAMIKGRKRRHGKQRMQIRHRQRKRT
jgi:hypothetical protein